MVSVVARSDISKCKAGRSCHKITKEAARPVLRSFAKQNALSDFPERRFVKFEGLVPATEALRSDEQSHAENDHGPRGWLWNKDEDRSRPRELRQHIRSAADSTSVNTGRLSDAIHDQHSNRIRKTGVIQIDEVPRDEAQALGVGDVIVYYSILESQG